MWQLKILKRAEKALEKLDRPKQLNIVSYLNEVLQLTEPHKKAKALTGKLVGLWRFRVGDFRIICQIDAKIITILVLDIGDRKEVYKWESLSRNVEALIVARYLIDMQLPWYLPHRTNYATNQAKFGLNIT